VFRWLCFVTLTAALAMSATGARAASAAVTCATAPGVRHVERVDGYRTKADAERAVRARCRASASTFYARSAPIQERVQERIPRPNSERLQERLQERACRRYPNLC